MSFTKYLVAFALCYLQVCSASNDQFSYDVCMENVQEAMSAFTDKYAIYQRAAYNWITHTNITCTKKLAELHEENCESLDVVHEIFKVCGGIDFNVGDFYPTMDDIETGEKACTWISENAPIFVERLYHNRDVVKTCDVAKTFDQIVADGFCFMQEE